MTAALRAITYTVAQEAVEATEDRVRAVLQGLTAQKSTLRYVAARVTGSATFTHVLDPAGAVEDLEGLPAFAEFQSHLRQVLIDGPHVRDVGVLGSVGGTL